MTPRRPALVPAVSRLVTAVVLALSFSVAVVPAEAAPPPIEADSAIVVETSTGSVIYERRPDERRAIASATKLMTALLALEELPRSRVVPASDYRPAAIESQLGLRPGEELTVADLLRGLLLESASDAAVTLAEATSGSESAFVRAMNARARRLGLTNTRFGNPIGLDEPGNRSTARDLVRLTLALRVHPFFRRTVARVRVTLTSGDQPREVENRNTLVADPLVDGVKTGHTRQAEYVLVGSGRDPRGVRLISVVLGAPDEEGRNDDTRDLLTWGFRQFRRVRALSRGQRFDEASVPIRYRRGAELTLVAGRALRRVVRRDAPEPELRVVGIPEEVEGPLRRGQRIDGAAVRVMEGDRMVAEVPLVAASAVPEADFAQRFKDAVTRPYALVLLLLAVVATVLGVRALSRRRASPRRASTSAGPA